MITHNRIPLEQVVRPEPRGPRHVRLPDDALPALCPPQLAIPATEAELRAVTIEQLTLIGLCDQAPAYLFDGGYVTVGDVLDARPERLMVIAGFGETMLDGLRDAIKALM